VYIEYETNRRFVPKANFRKPQVTEKRFLYVLRARDLLRSLNQIEILFTFCFIGQK